MSRSILSSIVFAVAMVGFAGAAQAFDQSTRAYSDLLVEQKRRAIEPASYSIVTNRETPPARIDGNARYFGGKVRIVFIDGRAVKLPESVIVENVRKGHFVPVYEGTGAPLKKEDWVVSLPSWLGYATVDAAR